MKWQENKKIAVILVLIMVALTFSGMPANAQMQAEEQNAIQWDFEDGTTQGWAAQSPADMEIRVEAVGENNHALRLMYEYQDKQAQTWWVQTGIQNTKKLDLSGCRAVAFDVILDLSAIDGNGRFQCQANASLEGWTKFVHFEDTRIYYAPREDGDSELVKVACVSKIPEGVSLVEQLSIWVVGAAIDYTKPIYIDNIRLLEQAEDPEEAKPLDWTKETPVEKYGRLQVIGNQLCAQDGTPVQLRGMGFPLIFTNEAFINRGAMQALAYDWQCDLVRITVDVGGQYYTGLPEQKALICKALDYAIEMGMYVLLDWHVLTPGNPQDEAYAGAGAFFDEFSRLYGGYPNIIYEVCNEPNGAITWKDNIKPYAESMISIIRNNDPDSVIVVGTGVWSQEVDVTADDPILEDNLMYTLHFYAGTHKQSLRDKAQYALDKGIALFVTEWGVTAHTGTDGVFLEESQRWVDFMDAHKLSWANWCVSNSSADSAMLKSAVAVGEEDGLTVKAAVSPYPGTISPEGYAYWPEEQLSVSGKYVRGLIRSAHAQEVEPLKLEGSAQIDAEGVCTISAQGAGGQGAYCYTYYVFREGKSIYQNIGTADGTVAFQPFVSGRYQVCLYVQDGAGRIAGKQLLIERG